MLNSTLGCENPYGCNNRGRRANLPPKWLQPQVVRIRRLGCMNGVAGVLPFPASGSRTSADSHSKVKTRVDHRNTEEAALVRRIQAGDEIAFREIVERYQAKVFSIIYGILRNRNDAEDIAQQVFSKPYFAINSFNSRTSLITWIYRITVNECYDYLRKKRARRVVYESDFTAEE